MKILILDGDNFQALRIVRDIANRHIVLVGGLSRFKTLSFYSRYCNGFVYFNEDNISNFINVLSFIKSQKIDLIIPTTERSCLILNNYRKQIEEINECTIAMGQIDKLQLAFDKTKTFKFCKEHDIRTPLIDLNNSASLKTSTVVLKCKSSNRIHHDGSITRTEPPRYFRNSTIQHNTDKSKFFQEFVSGKTIGFFSICKNGLILDSYSHERILDTNPSGSGSCVRKSIITPKKLLSLAKKIISKLEWNGPIMLEFLQNEHNELSLLEINGRLWGSFCLSSFSGKNFTLKIIELYKNDNLDFNFKPQHFKEITITNEILLFLRWIRIIRGPKTHSSQKFPRRGVIFSELKHLFFKKEILSDYDPLPILRFLWKR